MSGENPADPIRNSCLHKPPLASRNKRKRNTKLKIDGSRSSVCMQASQNGSQLRVTVACVTHRGLLYTQHVGVRKPNPDLAHLWHVQPRISDKSVTVTALQSVGCAIFSAQDVTSSPSFRRTFFSTALQSPGRSLSLSLSRTQTGRSTTRAPNTHIYRNHGS